ncbi:MAG: hypothetical protein IBX68_02520 [Dehalococcoidia bacterium]|nr:hypothetical protein [Dehalococcoidia bacterium]
MPLSSDEAEIAAFFRQYAGDHLRMELLAFWSRHPNTRFTEAAIRCALDCSKQEMLKALASLVDAGIVERHRQNELVCYSLTMEETKRRSVLELAGKGWDRWRSLARQIDNAGRSVR